MEKRDPQLIGPVCFWKAEDYPKLYINASYSTKQASNSTKGRIYWLQRQGSESFNEQNSIPFEVKADGMWHVYKVDLSQVSTYSGAVYRLRFDPADTGVTGSYIKLAFIHTQG